MKYWHPHLPFGQNISVSTLALRQHLYSSKQKLKNVLVWTNVYCSCAGGLVLIVRTVCCSRNVLCFTGLGPEDWYIVRTVCYSRNVLCFTGLGPEDWYSSWGLLVVLETCYVLLVLCRRTGAHREDCLLFQKRAMFYWSWAGGLVHREECLIFQKRVIFYWSCAGGQVLIVRTACCSRNVLCFTGLGPKDWCSLWGLLVVLETCYVLLVLCRRTGAHREDCLLFQKRVMFYWSWAGGQVLIVRTVCCSRNVLCFTGLGPEDWYSSWGLLVVPETCDVLLVLGLRTGAHREDCLLFQKRVMFYWSWAGAPVLIVRTACYSRNLLCFTGLGPEDWYSSWGLFVVPETCYVLLVLGQRTGAHREDWLLFQKRVVFYWSWAKGPVLIVRTACCSRNVLCFTGLGPEDRYIVRTAFCSRNVLCFTGLGRRTGAHREDCLLF